MWRCEDVRMRANAAAPILWNLDDFAISSRNAFAVSQKENLILQLTFQFALDIIEFCDILEGQRKYIIAKQLLKAGTSIGANTNEAQNAESRADFIHKIKVGLKETDESIFWLKICEAAPSYTNPGKLLDDAQRIKRVLSKIISTSKSRKAGAN
jgi:four helix bundle protein